MPSNNPISTVPETALPEDSEAHAQEVAADSGLTEDHALAMLKEPDLSADALEQLSKNAVSKSRKVRLAMVEHPRTPRHVSVPLIRHLFTFELMQVALTPVAPADIKVAAEEALIHRLEKISSGERLTLARRASGRVAGTLLFDPEPRVMRTALENSRLTEASVIKNLLRRDAPAHFVEAVCHHSKWSLRREVRVALLRNEKTPMARALEFARTLPPAQVREVLHSSRLSATIRNYLLRDRGESSH